MISNERPSPYYRRDSYRTANPQYSYPPKPPVNEDTLKTEYLHVERKIFTFALKENVRGRLLRITEENAGRRNSIIIPSTGLADFKKLLEEMIKAADKQSSTNNPTSAD